MPTPPLSPEKIEQAKELRRQGKSLRDIVKLVGISYGSASHYCSDIPVGQSDTPNTISETGDTLTIDKVYDGPIRTLQDAIRVAQVDLTEWYVDKWEATQWTVGMKLGLRGEETVHRSQQYRVKMTLKRIAPKHVLRAIDAICDRIKRSAPKFPALPPATPTNDSYMGVFCLFDAHFGKLAWAAETGKDYDLKIADSVYRNAIIDLVNESQHRKLAYAVMPIGNDFFHVDNNKNQTTAGTQVDTDGRKTKIVDVGVSAIMWAVEQLAAVCPVYCPAIPGNHDYESTFWTARILHAHFSNTKRVTVDLEPGPRKYVHWGCNLVGLHHGNDVKPEKLPALMAQERPREWAESKCREWLQGHSHRTQQWMEKSADTFEGTTVRTVQALCSTDAWHHQKGFIGSRSAAEVYWYSRSRGYAGHCVVDARV